MWTFWITILCLIIKLKSLQSHVKAINEFYTSSVRIPLFMVWSTSLKMAVYFLNGMFSCFSFRFPVGFPSTSVGVFMYCTCRLAWMLVFLSGICFSGYFCWQMWQKWDESPIITSVETQMYPLKNVPFPAITICSVNKVSKRRLMKALENPKLEQTLHWNRWLLIILLFTNKRFENVSYSKLQSTLRYMTKLDRAINNEKELDELNEFYQSHNISALDLFYILEEVNNNFDSLPLPADVSVNWPINLNDRQRLPVLI